MIRIKYVLILTLALISGCTNAATVGNALNLGQTHGIDCVPGNAGESRMFGDTFLSHEGNKVITITDVSLVGANNITLTKAVLVKLKPDEALVGFGEWPPNDDFFPLPDLWEERIPAENTIIKPGEEWNLVFVLNFQTSDTGSTDAVKIIYEDSDSKKYVQETLIKYFITSQTCEKVLKENPL